MRIFLSCQQALRDHPVPAYSFWRNYFLNALEEAGHEVLETPGVDWAEGLVTLSPGERFAWWDRTWGSTVDFLRREHARKPVDLFLGYLFPEQVEPAAVRAISGMGIPTVNFFCDNVREFVRVPDSFRSFDLHWVPEAEAAGMYSSQGLPFIDAPMPMWVAPNYRSVAAAEDNETLFIGSHDELREDLLGRADRLGLEFQIYGAGWQASPGGNAPRPKSVFETLGNQVEFLARHGIQGFAARASYRRTSKGPSAWIGRRAHGPVIGEAYFERTRQSRVILGINRCPSYRRPFSDPIRYSRLRDIEAPMLGACYLTEMAPGLADMYELGTEIETYGNAEELVEKVAMLSKDRSKRTAMRTQGQRRALETLNVGRTIGRISARLGLKDSTSGAPR